MNLKQVKTKLNNNAELIFNKLGMNIEVFGDNIYSTCPIHDSSDNPRAFSFSKTKGIWKCWTRDCQEQFNNDIFGLIQGVLSNKNNTDTDFKFALKWACDLFDIKKQRQEITLDNEYTDFLNIINIINENQDNFVPKYIDINYKIKYPSEYFISRGFNEKTLLHFNVGDCIENSGTFKDRSIIPIYDETGKNIVGIIGRSVKEYKSPKFLLYPKGFDKRYFFYNYHNAIEKAIETSCLFILEGQGDVWKLYEHGVLNAVSIFGKSISKEQEDKLLKLPITHLIILTDNDQAGRESKIQIQRQLGRSFKLTFPKISAKDVGEMSELQIQNMLKNLKGTY